MIHSFMMNILSVTMTVFNEPSASTPAEAFQDNITFFSTWIARIGSFIAFIGAVKLCASIKSDDAKEQFGALMVMVSGFMIAVAVNNMGIFKIPATYTAQAANTEFRAIVTFISKWTRRAGMAVMFFGAAALMYSVKSEDAGSKALATRSVTAGACIAGVSAAISMFV